MLSRLSMLKAEGVQSKIIPSVPRKAAKEPCSLWWAVSQKYHNPAKERWKGIAYLPDCHKRRGSPLLMSYCVSSLQSLSNCNTQTKLHPSPDEFTILGEDLHDCPFVKGL